MNDLGLRSELFTHEIFNNHRLSREMCKYHQDRKTILKYVSILLAYYAKSYKLH